MIFLFFTDVVNRKGLLRPHSVCRPTMALVKGIGLCVGLELILKGGSVLWLSSVDAKITNCTTKFTFALMSVLRVQIVIDTKP
jgi:hypothetical protein